MDKEYRENTDFMGTGDKLGYNCSHKEKCMEIGSRKGSGKKESNSPIIAYSWSWEKQNKFSYTI